ncbi:hypothetical protein [Segetibacter koreensis]|uniref:hypothetical protein n=1 Tax=Segetibacter koreensis TaxID=398037 RepID=UPI0003724B5C|nr:hypothetical protein [Segetibacter koreensis]
MSSNFLTFKKKLANALVFRTFLLTKVPAAFFAGVRLEKLEMEESAISVQYNWFTKNPFRSVYFAVLLMPAEISTGILCIGYLYKRTPAVSMLLVHTEGDFLKKATGKIVFTCTDGMLVSNAINKAVSTGEATAVRCHSIGKNEKEEIVADFYFTWSFKARIKA